MSPKSLPVRHLAIAVLAPLVIAVAGNRAHAGNRHLALVKSEPKSDAKLAQSPKAIDLWFSQKPNLKLTRLVLTSASHDTLELQSPVIADTSGKHVSATLVTALALGKYDVNWRTVSRDGHAVAGKFAFTIDTATSSGTTAAASLHKPR